MGSNDDMSDDLGGEVDRAGLKSKDARVDLEKAVWYLEREIARLGK